MDIHGISGHTQQRRRPKTEKSRGKNPPWNSMRIFHGYPWNSPRYTPWIFHGIPWISMEIHGYLWKCWQQKTARKWNIHGMSMEYPWNSMDIHGYPPFSVTANFTITLFSLWFHNNTFPCRSALNRGTTSFLNIMFTYPDNGQRRCSTR